MDKALRKKYYYLNYLEIDTWYNNNNKNNKNNSKNKNDQENGHTDEKTKLMKKKNEDVNLVVLEKVGSGKKGKSNYQHQASLKSLARSPLEVRTTKGH